MTSLKGDLRSIMGTPFGGVGHAVLIFSRVTRAAFDSDSVILQLHDRIEMPEEADGKFRIDGLDPGPVRVELEGGTVHNHGWNIDLPDEGTWSLADLVDAQVDWSPAVIGRAEAAAREARDHADRAEAGADRVGTAEQVGTWASEASSSASDASSARSGALTARDAARTASDAAEGHASRAATSETNAAASESAAKQSETNAGDYAAVATTAATEAVDAMDSVSDIIGANYATHEYVDSKNWVRTPLSTGDDLNSLGQSGVYVANRGYIMSSLLNRPEGAGNQGVIEHIVAGDVKFQRLIHSRTSWIEIWQRVFYGGEWSTWERVNPPKSERVTTGTDLDSLVGQNIYQVPNSTVANSLIGKPDNISGAISHAVLEVLTNGSRTVQRWTTLPEAATKSITATRHRDTVGEWSTWELAGITFGSGSGGGSSEDPFRIDKLRQNSRIRRGGIIGTDGRTPIALTFDHGFAKFRDLLLPHIIRLGLPCTVAFNSDTMGVTENDGVEWETLEQWCLQHGIEIAHHGRLHMSVDDALTNQDAVEHQFLSTIDDIRNNCPDIIADAFILPGSGGGGHEGFGNGLDDKGDSLWWSHPVGRTILSNFPVVTGDLLGVTIPATGTPVQTMDRISFDYNSGIITGRNKIRSCYGTNLGGVLFMHPNLLDDGTHTDAYRMVDFLEWLASEREAGNIEVLTLSGFAWATADSTRRFDLMRDKWVNDSATADLDLIQWIRGAQMMVTTTADSNGPLTITAADDSGKLAASITHDALEGEVYRMVFSIPKTANTITVTTAGTSRSVRIV